MTASRNIGLIANGKEQNCISILFKVKGQKDLNDTVAYTIFGPVMYDKSYSGDKSNQ